MPILDGYTATQKTRKWEQETSHSNISIIAITAYAQKYEQEKSLLAGCNQHLSKPVSKENLLHALEI